MLRYFWPSDDEQLAGQWTDAHFDEDASWWVGLQRAGAVAALATGLSLVALSTTVATNVYSQHQDDPAGFLSITNFPLEEYWQNSVPPVVWPQPKVSIDDDAHPTFVPAFVPDDGDSWHQLIPPVVASNYLNLPFLDPEEIPVGSFPTSTNPVDDSAVWIPQLQPQDPDLNLWIFLDDGSWVPAMEPDEDFWPSSSQPAPYNWPQPQQPFDEGDDNLLVPQFPAYDDIWQQLVAPTVRSLAWPTPWQFEQNEVPVLAAFTDEIFWQNPTAPVPDSLWVLQQFKFEQTDATGSLNLTLDDGFRPDFVQPEWGNLRPLQQWQFEQNEPAGSLYTLRDEDFWINPVAPVNWPQPAIFTFDEQIVPQSIATIDELLSSAFVTPWVQPTPPSLYLRLPYLPEPEEIPAGSLIPALPPPPPPFCPLPPAGPDADVSMSIFGGSAHPLLALFCRVCNSGKPLVIRADYAIWCQDCCSFVSKADTYMGTVRAPGKLKGVF